MPELLQTLAIMQPQCVSLLWWMAVLCATSLPARKTTYNSSGQPAGLTRHYCNPRVDNNDLFKHVHLVQQVPLMYGPQIHLPGTAGCHQSPRV